MVTSIVEFCNCSMFCCVYSSFAIISMGKSELVALLCLTSWCLGIVVWLFLTIPRICLLFVIMIFPDHTHLLFILEEVFEFVSSVPVCYFSSIVQLFKMLNRSFFINYESFKHNFTLQLICIVMLFEFVILCGFT